MKTNYYLLLALSFFIISCSSSDDSSSNNDDGGNELPALDFLPDAIGNYWVYDVQSPIQNGRDSLYVANDTVISGNSNRKFKTRYLSSGFFTSALRNNGVRKFGGKILLSGAVEINFADNFPLAFDVDNFVIFQDEATPGQSLGSTSGTVQQQYNGLALDFNYTLSSKAGETLDTYTASNGETYTNVRAVKTTLNLKVSTSYAGVPFTILSPQDVVVSTQYYAEGIGVVHNVNDFNYQLNNLGPINLPIPNSASEQQQEVLLKYQAN